MMDSITEDCREFDKIPIAANDYGAILWKPDPATEEKLDKIIELLERISGNTEPLR